MLWFVLAPPVFHVCACIKASCGQDHVRMLYADLAGLLRGLVPADVEELESSSGNSHAFLRAGSWIHTKDGDPGETPRVTVSIGKSRVDQLNLSDDKRCLSVTKLVGDGVVDVTIVDVELIANDEPGTVELAFHAEFPSQTMRDVMEHVVRAVWG